MEQNYPAYRAIRMARGLDENTLRIIGVRFAAATR